jgi:hypothetical protein
LSLRLKANAYWRLGASSIFDVLVYRVGLKSGLHPVLKINPAELPTGDFFAPSTLKKADFTATDVWQDRPWAFGRPAGQPTDNPPDWHANILTGARVPNPGAPWQKIVTFSEQIGDIKTVWEASRFDWVIAFAQASVCGDDAAIAKLNCWLANWAAENPAYFGPNWVCGQEASLRVAHLALAAVILGQVFTPSLPLMAFLLNHLRRIKPTVAYARGQDNNHATSEAMALFVGGLWLEKCGQTSAVRAEATVFHLAGRKLMEERVRKLIFGDGGFAQYSIVYHRLMLDSLSVTEYWRSVMNSERFSETFYEKALAATDWLAHFTDLTTGDAPNLGSNDGAWLLPIGSGGFRDFRPSCALASTLFSDRSYFSDCTASKEMLAWFGLQQKDAGCPPTEFSAKVFADSGIVILKNGKTRAFIRLPGYAFRPVQADALHVDIWHDGQCLLQDAGTYSYAANDWLYYPSTAAHNSIEFDGRDQMPRLGRFLYGEWLSRDLIETTENSATIRYVDYWGAVHLRTITVQDEFQIDVVDNISGIFKSAVLRWRPSELAASPTKTGFQNQRLKVTVASDAEITRVEMTPHKTSTYYLQSVNFQALEVEVMQACRLHSRIEIFAI